MVGETYNRNHSVGLQESTKSLQELEGKQVNWLSTARKDIVDNVVVRLGLVDEAGSVADSVRNGWGVVLAHVEVLLGKLVDDWINLDNRGINAVGYKSRWGGSDTKTTDTVSEMQPQRRRLTQREPWLLY